MRRKSVTSSMVVVSLLTFSAVTEAARVENRFSGRVQTAISGAAQAALAALGVSQGATAQVVLGVDDSIQGTPVLEAGFTTYNDAITDWTIDIGGFRAEYDPARLLNHINVTDNSGQPPVDLYGANVFLASTADLLGIGANAVLLLAEFGNGAISSDAAAQDLSRFDSGSIAVGGSGAIFSIILDLTPGGGGGPSKPPTCLPAQLQATAALCKAAILCRAKSAAGPALDACDGKARGKFVAKYDAAAVKAGRKGEQCRSLRDGAGAAVDILEALGLPASIVLEGADPGSKDDGAYRAALLNAAAGAVDARLKALATDAKKPDPGRLDAALESVESRLAQSIEKAAASASKKGIEPDVDAGALIAAVNSVADLALGIATGAEPGGDA